MSHKNFTILFFAISIQLISCINISSIPTPAFSVSATEAFTLLPTNTITPTLFPTNTPIPTATWTPLPTILPNQFPDMFLGLLNTNAGCELPCWLGISPGKTTTPEALHFFSQFPIEIGELRKRGTQYNGEYHLTSAFGFRIDISGKFAGTVDITSTDEIINTMLIQYKEYRSTHQLSQLLKSLGKPNEIHISAQASSPEQKLASTIFILDYRDKDILVWYQFPTIRTAENLQLCINSESTNLALWDPSFDAYRIPTDEYLINISGFSPKRLEEVTTFNLDTFYEAFLNGSSGKCIETPANLWP